MEQSTNGPDRVEVHVKSLVTGENANFAMPADATLQTAWDESYVQLNEARRNGDTFRCADGTDLTPMLGLSLRQVREEKICDGERFEIRGPSGGA